MVGPRIVFTRFASPQSAQLRPWREHTARVRGVLSGALEPVVESGTIVWSLISANNRELARGGAVHDAYDDAVSHASSVVAASAELEPRLTAERTRGTYGWYLVRVEQVELVCARWYDTVRYRNQAMDAARAALPVAVLVDGARYAVPRSARSREYVGS